MSDKPNVVVIGSGFGGAVFACRLAEKQTYSVHVLERGRRYGRNEFPRRPDQLREAFWDPDDGMFGLFEYQSFYETDIDVWTASGVGGGSLIYANVLYEMPPEFFEGWPGGITRQVLDPYYAKVIDMMEARSYPINELPYSNTPKTKALQRANERMASDPLGKPGARLEWPKLALQFGPPGDKLNKQGVPQSNCLMCGECNIGCNYHAKNTLDLNYLARAEKFGATVHANAEVWAILREPDESGYLVVYRDPRFRSAPFEQIKAKYVIVSAGSLGSTKLLLRMKHSGQLPHLSTALGTKWSGNGDLLGLSKSSAQPVYPSTGPTITAAVRFFHGSYPDGFAHGLFVEDAAVPNLLAWYLAAMSPTWQSLVYAAKGAVDYLRGFVAKREPDIGQDVGPLLFRDSKLVSRTLVYLGMGRDRSTGVIQLRKRGSSPLTWKDDCEVHLSWQVGPSRLHFDRLRDAMRRLTEALDGQFVENPLSYLTRYIAVHPLGGCPISDSEQDGVVNARTGEVFGHRGLYVADGSIIPTSVGPNPSLTIAAITEMFAERFPS